MPVMSLSAQQFALSQMAAGPPRHNDQPQKEITVLRARNAGRGTDECTIRNLFVTTFAKAPAVVVEGSREDEELFIVSQSAVFTVQNPNLQRTKPHVLEFPETWNSLVLVTVYEDALGEIPTWSNYPSDISHKLQCTWFQSPCISYQSKFCLGTMT